MFRYWNSARLRIENVTAESVIVWLDKTHETSNQGPEKYQRADKYEHHGDVEQSERDSVAEHFIWF